MDDQLSAALRAVLARLVEYARSDTELRAHLRQLAEELLMVSEPNGSLPSTTARRRSSAKKQANDLPPSPPSARWVPTRDEDLPLIEERCRLKAEAARWAIERRERLAAGVDFRVEIEPYDARLIARAKELPDCYLWMNHPNEHYPSDRAPYQILADCFDALADALRVARSTFPDADRYPQGVEQSLILLAEAQSSLRVAVQQFDEHTDPDQTRIFHWLRAKASEHQLFIQRFMRVDDPADPSAVNDLAARIRELQAEWSDVCHCRKRQRKAMNKIRHKVSLIADSEEDQLETWLELAKLVDEAIQAKLPPTDEELGDLLLPILDRLPSLPKSPRGFQLVLDSLNSARL